MLTPIGEKQILGIDGDDAPCIEIRRLLSGLPNRLRSKGWFVILQVGVDETGYGQAGPNEAFVFAGYVGPVTHVEAFTHLWDAILNKEPAMAVKQFKRRVRSTGTIDPRVLQLVHAIPACYLHGVRFKVGQDDHATMIEALRKAAPAHPSMRLWASNPYFFAFMALLFSLIGTIWKDPDVKLEVIYDENLRERKRLEQGYQFFRRFAEQYAPAFLAKLAKDPIPRNDEEFSLIQAADALAWHSHRHHVENAKGNKHENEIWTILNSVPFFVDFHWKAEDLRDATGDVVRALLNKYKP